MACGRVLEKLWVSVISERYFGSCCTGMEVNPCTGKALLSPRIVWRCIIGKDLLITSRDF